MLTPFPRPKLTSPASQKRKATKPSAASSGLHDLLPVPKLGAALPLPHERDEAAGSAASAVDPVIAQAKRDIDGGLVDTDMYATPGLDAAQRADLVPGPGGKPPGQALEVRTPAQR